MITHARNCMWAALAMVPGDQLGIHCLVQVTCSYRQPSGSVTTWPTAAPRTCSASGSFFRDDIRALNVSLFTHSSIDTQKRQRLCFDFKTPTASIWSSTHTGRFGLVVGTASFGQPRCSRAKIQTGCGEPTVGFEP